jgi:hypothetical protein
MSASITIRLGIAITVVGVLISGCQPIIQQQSLPTSISNIIIPTEDKLPDLNDAVPIPEPNDTRESNQPEQQTPVAIDQLDQPTHVAAKVPESTFTTIEPARIALPPAPKAPKFYPSNTMGWPKQDLIQILGHADYIRRDGDGEVHQYKLDTCILDFTLFPVNGTIEVIAWHGRSRIQHMNIDANACYENLASRKASQ